MGKITDRIDNITGMKEKHFSLKPPTPESVKIELTGKCNFRCGFCAHNDRLRQTGAMDWDLFKRVVKEMREAGVEELGMFYLGESFLDPRLPEAIRDAKEDCGYPYVFLTTNGSLSTPEKVKECMEAGLDSLKFSLNYADEEQFKEIARVKGELFYTIAENVKGAYKVREEGGYNCTLSASFIEYTGDQADKIEEYLADLSPHLDEMYALPLYNQAALVENEDWTFVQGNRGRLDALRDPLPCWSIFTEGHISFDGRLSACCFDHDSRFDMGDLNTTSFMDAWHSEKFQELRAKHIEKRCDRNYLRTMRNL